jgi:type II secretory pathway pseudopilin PulG
MGVDRTGASSDKPAEAAEEPPPAERQPPPDRPGAEDAPSRADSRNGAAAANETSNQAAENQGKDKPDTAQASQESPEREDNTTVDNEPETPGTSGSNEDSSNDDGIGEQYDNKSTEEDTGGRPDIVQPSGELGDPKGTEQREQAPNGRTTPHDSTSTEETGGRPAPAGDAERTEDRGAGKTTTADANDLDCVPPPSAVDIGDRPDNAPRQPEDAPVSAPDTQESPRDSFDASPDDAVEAAAPPEEEAAANTDDASRGGTEMLARRFESLNEADLRATDERPRDVMGTTNEEQGSRVESTSRDDSTSERAEPPWATGGLDIAGDLPTGEELVKMENDKQSRAERARRKVYESGDEVLDDVGKVVNRVDQIFERPPTGHPETRMGPEVGPAPHDGINAADAATALIAVGVIVGEIFRRGRERLKQTKGVR